VRDFDGLLRFWLDSYPGHGGISTYWLGLSPPRDQAFEVIRHLGTGTGPIAVVSGDVAADVIAPWRTPARAVVYTHAGANLSGAGLVQAAENDATLQLIVPQDPGVWPSEFAVAQNRQLPLADPLQVLWDVQRSPGSDTDETVTRLSDVLRERSRTQRTPGAS
jgi:hypothetical protein